MSRMEKQRRRQRRKERKFQRQFHRDRSFWDNFPQVYELDDVDDADGDRPRALTHLSYDITREPLPGGDSVLDQVLTANEHARLYAQTMTDPEAALPRLRDLLARYPADPMLLNWLGRCHAMLEDFDEVERLARLNYERNPAYLFAKVNLAQVALQRGEVDQVPVIFDNKFDLKLLYPHRSVFHVTEFTAFAAVMAEYFMRTDEHEAAGMILETMEEIDPNHELTVALRELLTTSFLLRAARKVLGAIRRKSPARKSLNHKSPDRAQM